MNNVFRNPKIEFLIFLLNSINIKEINIQTNNAMSRVEKLSSILFILRFLQVLFLFFTIGANGLWV